MKVLELAKRYAKSLFDIIEDKKSQEKVLADLRALDQALAKETDVREYLGSPLVDPEARATTLEAALKNSGAHEEVNRFLALLVRKNRFPAFSQIVEAYQQLVDEANGVVRGTVRSAANLGPGERQQIESIVEKVLKKKVIMTYKTDPTVIGGLVAQVGSYTFDDSLDSHLNRLSEELKRRAL